MKRNAEAERRRLDAAAKAMGAKLLDQLDPQDGWMSFASSPHVMWLGWVKSGRRVDLGEERAAPE